MSLEDVARVTKIQPRILERLEGGTAEGLPADVFVRGFVRSVARCLGLDEAEALRRYSACAVGPAAPVVAVTARAMVDAMADLAPRTAAPQVLQDDVALASGSLQDLPRADEPVAPPASTPAVVAKPSKKKIRGKGRNRRRRMAAGTDSTPLVAGASGAANVAPSGSSANDTAASASRESDVDIAASRDSDADLASRESDSEIASRESDSEITSRESDADLAASASRESDADLASRQSDSDLASRESDADLASRQSEADIAASADVAHGANADVAHGAASADVAHGAASATSAAATSDAAVATEVASDRAELDDEPPVTEPWQPKMPVVVAASVPWRRPPTAATAPSIVVPSLVIDDADPDVAEQVLEDRAAAKAVLTTAQRRSFLPPILLDREDRGSRQGGLTLAVILLLIAATLTLSYLMRRPSSSGDGVTGLAAPGELIG